VVPFGFAGARASFGCALNDAQCDAEFGFGQFSPALPFTEYLPAGSSSSFRCAPLKAGHALSVCDASNVLLQFSRIAPTKSAGGGPVRLLPRAVGARCAPGASAAPTFPAPSQASNQPGVSSWAEALSGGVVECVTPKDVRCDQSIDKTVVVVMRSAYR
jgi:hypothetical protein